MDHVAIIRQDKFDFPERLLKRSKTIESRWLTRRSVPFDRVVRRDRIYFKLSGGPVFALALVAGVMQFQDLNPQTVLSILNQYEKELGLTGKVGEFFGQVRDKHYAVLLELEEFTPIGAFMIDKRGFGLQSAWLTVPDIDTIRI